MGRKHKSPRSKSPPTVSGVSAPAGLQNGPDERAGTTNKNMRTTNVNRAQDSVLETDGELRTDSNMTTGVVEDQSDNIFPHKQPRPSDVSHSTEDNPSVLQPDLSVPTNDGTYRLTIRWNIKGDFSRYHEELSLWLTDVHALLSDMFPGNDCYFYRWESVDLQSPTTMKSMSPGELRDFISPNVSFLQSTTQIIFGVRVCFAEKFPGQRRTSENTVRTLADNNVQVSISNSTTSSGRIVTAGYLLFKAARTTHRNRYLQSLRKRLPKETPFFDILLYQRTPMEQKMSHLVIQCGEAHVLPLSQALSALLTGHNAPLFLSRLALAKLQPQQISEYFEMQDRYAKH